jgi:hypothetical protein
MSGYHRHASRCSEEVARTPEQHAYARRRTADRILLILILRLATARRSSSSARNKHDSLDDIKIDARPIERAERDPKRVEYGARRLVARSGEHPRRAQQQRRPFLSLSPSFPCPCPRARGAPPRFAGEQLQRAEPAAAAA